jgi:hypothetical protein
MSKRKSVCDGAVPHALKRQTNHQQNRSAEMKSQISIRKEAAKADEPTARVYKNTSDNAAAIGWDRLPEYCIGDSALPYVIHDHRRGLFIFSASPA